MKKLLLLFFAFITLNAFSQITSPYNTFVGCRPTSITLQAPYGYHHYLWSTGETTKDIEYVLVGTGTATLDTSTVSLICYDQNNNDYPQGSVVVRSIREPQLLSNFNKKYNYSMTDSIKSDLVLTYLNYAPQYVFTFIQTDTRKYGLVKISKYVSNNRWCPLDKVYPALEKGKYYHVTVHARVNNINYCKGNYGEIGIKKDCILPTPVTDYEPIDVEVYPNPTKDNCRVIIDSDDHSPMNVRIYDIAGKLVYDYDYRGFPINEDVGNYLETPGVYKVVMIQGEKIKTSTIEKL
jgi:hypothetical protein